MRLLCGKGGQEEPPDSDVDSPGSMACSTRTDLSERSAHRPDIEFLLAYPEAARPEAAETEPKLFKQIDHLLTLRRNLNFQLLYIAACMAEDLL